MADEEKTEEVAEQVEPRAKGCPVGMYGGHRCGRPLYKAVYPGDKSNLCLMHTHDPNKEEAAFQAEFERLLMEAGDSIADFSHFVFPSSNYAGRIFAAKCIFARATFTQDAHFRKATFTQDAGFEMATFMQLAGFFGTTFTKGADFGLAKFTKRAYFFEATFTEAANFYNATFAQGLNIMGATFACTAAFNLAAFEGNSLFNGATFSLASDFSGATFAMAAVFVHTTFSGAVRFINTIFKDSTSFWFATFADAANFRRATFAHGVEFRETIFRHDSPGADSVPGPIFTVSNFQKPEMAIFYKAYLGQALFHDCDVSRLTFSNVDWRRRPGSGKRMVFEESVDLQHSWASALRLSEAGPEIRNYALIAELYQQLKKNYDDRRDYWTAGDFHYGEMEMKRLSSPRGNKVSRWMHRNLGLVAWYKYASEYGESYVRPALWTAVIVLLFTLLYPLTGLSPGAKQGKPPAQSARAEQSETDPSVSYETFLEFVRKDPDGVGVGVRRFFGHSLMTTLGIAFFQRDLDYQPSYPWGRVLQWVELLLTSSLIALFLLAVRRQFRR